MARSTERPTPPRLSEPDLPGRLAPAEPERHGDFLQASLDVAGEFALAHSGLEQCTVSASAERLDLTGATLLDVEMTDVRVASLGARDATIRRLRIAGGRIGTLDLADARIAELELRGLRIDYLSLGSARGEDILVTDCTIRALDMPLASLTRLAFEDCRADEVDTRGLRAADVDLRGLDALGYLDTAGLKGTTLSARQVELLAPAFAAATGIQVSDG